jgi:hypothetical protein
MTACSGGEDSTPTQPFGEPHEREERERWRRRRTREREGHLGFNGLPSGAGPLRWAAPFHYLNNIYLIIIHLININCISFNSHYSKTPSGTF